MLNSYIWGLYKQTAGQKVTDMFRKNLSVEFQKSYANEINIMHTRYAIEQVTEENRKQLQELAKEIIAEEEPIIIPGCICGTAPTDVVFQTVDSVIHEDILALLGEGIKEQDLFASFIECLSYTSTSWAIQFPGVFTPYYFSKNYNILTMIADTFGIDLPELPRKADYIGRILHYGELCKSFYRFRQENGLEFYEFCAFLYDFAPQYIGGKESYIINEIPEPKKAFLSGGSGKNTDASAEDDAEKIYYWQCKPNNRAGDAIVMYLRSPISAISSVWRSKSVGFIDPFFYYYYCTYIGNPVKGTRIKLQDIKSDSVLGKMAIVKKNMQGIDGVELKPSEYNHILDLTEAPVPKLIYDEVSGDGVYESERAVEEKLIKPLLTRLGYAETDYVQQMYVEIGNHNHALIPDFVIKPRSVYGHYSGEIIIEAKRSITRDRLLLETKTQVRSYAKLLGAKYAVIAAQEKIWVMSATDDYSVSVFESEWKMSGDDFYKLQHLIGKEA